MLWSNFEQNNCRNDVYHDIHFFDSFLIIGFNYEQLQNETKSIGPPVQNSLVVKPFTLRRVTFSF